MRATARAFMMLCVGLALKTIVNAFKPVSKMIQTLVPLGKLARTFNSYGLSTLTGDSGATLPRSESGLFTWLLGGQSVAARAQEIVQEVNSRRGVKQQQQRAVVQISAEDLLSEMRTFEGMAASVAAASTTPSSFPETKNVLIPGYMDFDPMVAATKSKRRVGTPGVKRGIGGARN